MSGYGHEPQRSRGLPRPIVLACGGLLLAGVAGSIVVAKPWQSDEIVAETASGEAAADVASGEPAAPMDETAMDANMSLPLEGQADELERLGEAAEAAVDAAAAPPVGTEQVGPRKSLAAAPVVAEFSCRVNGTEVAAALCITGTSDAPGGSLRVTSADRVVRYSPNEVFGVLSGNRARLSLSGNYRVEAQSNADPDYTLRLVVYRGSEVVYQNEGSAYDTLIASAATE